MKRTPKWLDPQAQRKRRSNAHEKRLATRLGGKRVPASGGKLWSRRDRNDSVQTDGADVRLSDFMIEHKRTDKESMSVKRQWLDQIKEVADRSAKDPGVILTYEDGRKILQEWVMIPLAVFERLRKNQTP